MTTLSASPATPQPAPTRPEPSAESRRFAAGMRVITALLGTVLLLVFVPQLPQAAVALLLAYASWAAWLMWREATDGLPRAPAWLYGIDVAWAVLMVLMVPQATMMLVVTLVYPVVLASITHGVGTGLLLAGMAAAGLALATGGVLTGRLQPDWAQRVPALMVLALVPAAAMIARPIDLMRRRMALVEAFDAEIDPRHGLASVCGEIVARLRDSTDADSVALVLPSVLGAPAMLAGRDEPAFRARHEAHARLEAMLAPLPARPLGHAVRPAWHPLTWRHRRHGGPQPGAVSERLAALAAELEVTRLIVVPLTRYAHQHGHVVVGFRARHGTGWDASALAAIAPELLRLVEQATLVDQLQDECASHERARIGRDLHDSAIQPYLGLKYAVESTALRIPPSNPARREVDSLADLVNGEVGALRELISTLRTGGVRGDSALVPSVRRQVRRFGQLFGIDVQLDCPDSLPTTRALASELFHVVNEVLNNIRKHTPARRVWIALSGDAEAIRLHVRDDAGSRLGHPVGDFHPASLDERVRELGGTWQIARPDGLNTEMRIRIPV